MSGRRAQDLANRLLPALVAVFNYAWFVGVLVSGGAGWGMMRGRAVANAGVAAAAPMATLVR